MPPTSQPDSQPPGMCGLSSPPTGADGDPEAQNSTFDGGNCAPRGFTIPTGDYPLAWELAGTGRCLLYAHFPPGRLVKGSPPQSGCLAGYPKAGNQVPGNSRSGPHLALLLISAKKVGIRKTVIALHFFTQVLYYNRARESLVITSFPFPLFIAPSRGN